MLSVLFALLVSGNLYAQQNIISGKIKSASGTGVHGATVLLYQQDSTLVKSCISSQDGLFEFEHVKDGKYFINVTATGYTLHSSTPFAAANNERVITPIIILKTAVKGIQGITVKGNRQKPFIEVTPDKTILNVENSISATGSTAFELLLKSPGVVTDKDDNITVKGKNGVRIYIDGRLSELQPADLTAYLKTINSQDIEAIEIIGNPSAKYDAAGNAGIINIKLKKNKQFGFTGVAGTGLAYGKHFKNNESLSLNYRNKKVGLFSNYGYNYSNNDNTFDLYRVQNDTLYDQKNGQNTKGHTQNIKAGADFFLSKKSTLGVIYTGNFTENSGYSVSRTPSISLKNNVISRVLYATNTIPANVKNQNVNLNYRYADTAGHEFSVDLDHGFFTSRKTSYQPNFYYSAPPETLLSQIAFRNNTPTDITINTQKADLDIPFQKGKLSLGTKFSQVKSGNIFDLYDVINGSDVFDKGRSNIFNYKENINAGYLNYAKPLTKKIRLQAGLRMENTVSEGVLSGNDAMPADWVKRNYTDLFPSLAVGFTLDANNLLNFNYSRRIDRPNYSDLNPFEARVDELTYIKGNAFLKPQYTNSFQVGHTFKSKYVTTLGYSHVKDYSTYVLDSTEKIRTFITKKNLASQDVFNISFFVPVNITKWWQLYNSLNVYHSLYNADFGASKKIDIHVTAFSYNMQQSFKIVEGFSGELTGYYMSPFVSAATFKNKGLGSVDAGLQKAVLHNLGSVRVSLTDVFNTLHWTANSNYGGTYMHAESRWESRQVRLNFTYRFGNTKSRQAGQRGGGSDDESKRTNADGFGN